MLGFHPIASFPISDIEDTIVGIAQRDAKIKIWTVPSRKTEWTIPVCKLEATLPARSDTWTVPS
jgi:hypothetical protein